MSRHLGEVEEVEESEIDITPMLDVVFILLIFFIVTATFVKESGLDVSRPDNQEAVTKDEKDNILIMIDANNGIFVNRRKTDIRRVTANIERLHAEMPEATVVILPDGESSTDTLIRVMDASREANVYAISIANAM
ncbi:MAG: ExbD/TolR family protein [Gammaproteobacteria bacterium]